MNMVPNTDNKIYIFISLNNHFSLKPRCFFSFLSTFSWLCCLYHVQSRFTLSLLNEVSPHIFYELLSLSIGKYNNLWSDIGSKRQFTLSLFSLVHILPPVFLLALPCNRQQNLPSASKPSKSRYLYSDSMLFHSRSF